MNHIGFCVLFGPPEEPNAFFFDGCHAMRSVARFTTTVPGGIVGFMQPKEHFLNKLAEHVGPAISGYSLLDLGSGQSSRFSRFFERYPQLTYVGVEPNPSEAAIATKLLAGSSQATVYNRLAYDPVPGAPFDICLSLSVLEHVKQLDRFLENSVAMTKRGGHIVHRYDLGHSLYPSSLKERFQVFLGNRFPSILPEHKFVRYVDPDEVVRTLERAGARVTKITYHQMRDHKRFSKEFVPASDEARHCAERVMDWEFDISPHLSVMPKAKREMLFPTICVWAMKE